MTRLRLLLLIVSIFFLTSQAHADYFQGMACGQHFSDEEGLILDMVQGSDWRGKEYRKKSDSILIADIEFKSISYLFLHDAFYGLAVDITNKDDYHEVIRSFQKKYGPPIVGTKVRKLIWPSDKEIIIAWRFSTHLAQIQIFCKEMYLEFYGIDDPDTQR